MLHTILLREHNKIATTLHEINNFWADEQLFEVSTAIPICGKPLQWDPQNFFDETFSEAIHLCIYQFLGNKTHPSRQTPTRHLL